MCFAKKVHPVDAAECTIFGKPNNYLSAEMGFYMIRKMQIEDCPAVARLWRDYLDVSSATDESVRKTYDKMSEDSRYGTYVAEEDGMVVGFITFVEVLSFDDPDGYIKMNGIAVLPEYRGRGIAQALTERAEQDARSRGANSIGAATSFKRTGSQTMLGRLGYQRSAFWFHKILSTPKETAQENK